MVRETEDPIMAARGTLRGTGILKAYLQEKKRKGRRENKKGSKAKQVRPRYLVRRLVCSGLGNHQEMPTSDWRS